MKLDNIRVLVKDFGACFAFYKDKLGLKLTWGNADGDYAGFVFDNNVGIALFKSDLMADALGTLELESPHACRDKHAVIIEASDVDEIYRTLSGRGVEFINPPTDMAVWGIRTAHLRDPEGNLIEFFSQMPKDKWDSGLLKEDENY